MTGPEREAFDALREALRILESEASGMLAMVRGEIPRAYPTGEAAMQQAIENAKAAFDLAEKDEPEEPVARLTLEQAHAIRNGWNAAVRSEQCALCRGTLVNCGRCMADGRLAEAGEKILAAAIKEAKGE